MAKKSARRTAAVELIVKRGSHGRYQKLKDKAADLPVMVSWDRRKSDRRAAAGDGEPNRRRADRRRNPPFTWEVSDFLVVEKVKQRKPGT